MNEKVTIVSNTIMNILNNFILHEATVCDNKNPLWFDKGIKSLFQQKKDTFKKYHKINNSN